jgi:HK97 gp10 family phage protein
MRGEWGLKIEGLRECEDALRELPRATGKNVLRRALLAASEPIADAWGRITPVFRGTLQKSVGSGTRLSRRQRGLHVKRSDVEVFVGAGPLPQAHMSEFGTAHQPAKPAGRPAWDNNKMKALASIKSDLWSEIEKARARLARKAARLAAKIR